MAIIVLIFLLNVSLNDWVKKIYYTETRSVCKNMPTVATKFEKAILIIKFTVKVTWLLTFMSIEQAS